MKNTMNKTEYILSLVWYTALSVLWFRSVCFIFVFQLNKVSSLLIYWIIVIVISLLVYKLTVKTQRNYLSVFINAILPNGIYLIITYLKYFTTIYWIVLGVGIALIISLAILIFGRKINQKANSKKINKIRLMRFLRGSSSVVAVCMFVLILSIGTNSLLGNPMYKTNVKSPSSILDSKPWTVEKQIDTVRKLEPSAWKDLTRKEKQEVLGVIRNIEIRYLGITHPVELGFTVLESETIGSYNENLQQILFDLEHLDTASANDVLHTLLHEIYHAYQHEQVRVLNYVPEEYQGLLMFANTLEYAEEYTHYENGDTDYFSYSSQTLEITANNYADSGVKQYYELIDKYTKGD